jgi:hypothetical protein
VSKVGAAFRKGETVDLITALRKERPLTQWGYVHVGPALLEEAADRLERLEDFKKRLLSHGALVAAAHGFDPGQALGDKQRQCFQGFYNESRATVERAVKAAEEHS